MVAFCLLRDGWCLKSNRSIVGCSVNFDCLKQRWILATILFSQSKTRNGKTRFFHHTELAAILHPRWCVVKYVVQQTLRRK